MPVADALVVGFLAGLTIGLLVMHHAAWRKEQDRKKMQRSAMRYGSHRKV